MLAAALLAAACGAATPEVIGPRDDEVVDEASGVRLIALERPTDGRVWLSLWIDAGARDGEVPAVAALAAWVAAADLEDVEARALADGIELSRPCRRSELDRCLRELADALSRREVDAAAFAAAEARLVAAQRAVAEDASRTADGLALEALLGASVDPLKGGAPSAEAIERFLRDHFGRGRALLVAVGDVQREALRAGVEAAFAEVPSARRERSEPAAEPRREVAVEVGDRSAVSIATLRADLGDAARIARAVLARLEPDLGGASASADVFPVRGGAGLVVRLSDGGEASRRALLERMIEVRDEPAEPDAEARPTDDPRAAARWLGARWVTRGAPADGGLGLGAVVPGGRGDAVDAADPDATLREQATVALREALAQALAPPALEGDVSSELVDATFAGARIRARRLSGASDVGVTVLFEGGASEEPERLHGATAALAAIAADACNAIATEELGARLEGLGVRVEPILTADAWGLTLVGPRERWQQLTYLAPRCAAAPRLRPDRVELARAALRERSRPLRAGLASLLSPSAPGRVAPTGGDGGAHIDPMELSRWRRGRVGARRARLAIAGDVPADEAARRLARGVARWPEGAPHEGGGWGESADRMVAITREGPLEAAIGWVAPASPGSAEVARAWAAAVARSLSSEPGLRATWSDGGTSEGHAWAGVVIRADETALDGLPTQVGRAIRAIAHAWPRLAEGAVTEARDARAWSGASVGPHATALALDAAPPIEPDAARELMERLAQAPPRFVVARPPVGR